MSLSQQADNHIAGALEKFKPDNVKVQPWVLFVGIGIITVCFTKMDVNLYYLWQLINFLQMIFID